MHLWIKRFDRHLNGTSCDVIEERVRSKVSRHSKRVQSIAVAARDVNGPRGGIDHVVRVLVRLKAGGSIIVRHRASDAYTGVSIAMERAVRAMRREAGRRRRVRRKAFRRNLAGHTQ